MTALKGVDTGFPTVLLGGLLQPFHLHLKVQGFSVIKTACTNTKVPKMEVRI